MAIQKPVKESESRIVIEKPSGLNTKMWVCEGFEPQPLVETVWPILAKLNPKPTTTDLDEDITDLQEMRVPIMEGAQLFFTADKIEKLSLAIQVVMKRLSTAFVVICPSDDYDFPIFELDLFEYSDSVFFLLDFHPLRDLIVDAWYRQKYLNPIEPIWNKYHDLNAGKLSITTIALKSFLGPYSIVGWHKTDDRRENAARMTEATAKYLECYVDIVGKAEPVKDSEGKAFAIKKKNAMRAYYRTVDPSVARMSKELGFDLMKKSLNHAFF